MPSTDALIASLAGTRALVTGGAGFIGSHLVERIIEAGAERVAVVDDLSLGRRENLAEALERPGVTLDVADVCDEARLRALVEREGPFELCFNLAVLPLPHSLEHPRENVERNVAMTTSVCEVGRAGGFARLVQFSSSEVYGTALTVPMSEDHALGAHTPYAAAKLATDLVALSYERTFGLDTIVVRPFNAYGERQNATAYAGLIPVVIGQVLAGEAIVINGDGKQTRDMTHVTDTVRGALALAANADLRGRAFNVGHGTEVSVNAMVHELLDALERPGHPVLHGPDRPGDVRRLLADVTAARDAAGYAPVVSVADGFRRTVQWYLSVAPSPAR
jgi:UDP-glucose 4-epimerase